MRQIIHSLFFLVIASLLSSCYYSHPNKLDHWVSTDDQYVDSVNFMIAHHYWEGYNFETTDSLQLAPTLPGADGEKGISHLIVKAKEHLVVADIQYVPTDTIDSVWVKVASEQFTQGWVHEKTLLSKATPSDPISKFINNFSNSRTLIFMSLLGLFILLFVLQMIWKNKSQQRFSRLFYHSTGLLAPGGWNGAFRSIYPTLLCITISGAATLYGSIQKFVPTTWVEFYFHPTINPFSLELPPILVLFIISVWFIFIIWCTVVIDLWHHEPFQQVVIHSIGLACICVILYLIFTITVQIYVGFPLLLTYWIYAILRYRNQHYITLHCGNCGAEIPQLGICPYCGAINK